MFFIASSVIIQEKNVTFLVMRISFKVFYIRVASSFQLLLTSEIIAFKSIPTFKIKIWLARKLFVPL